jgi:hypothetical protein
MRVNQGEELALKPINMHGGGYSNFLDVIKTEANSNCLAKFIIIDLDRLRIEKDFVSNKYKIKKESMEILIKQTLVNWEQEHCKGSNIHEFFEILDW